MRKVLILFELLLSRVEKVLESMAAAFLAIFCICTMAQVVSRYFFSPLTWTEEVSRFSFIYMLFIGSTVGVRRMLHYSFDAAAKLKSVIIKKTINLIALLFQLAVFLFLSYTSFLFIPQMYARLSSVMQISMSIPYFSIILFSFISTLFTLEHLVKFFLPENIYFNE